MPIILTTSDNKEVKVERSVIERSKLIKGLLEDTNDADASIPLMNVNEETLLRIIEYCEHHRDDPVVEEEEDDEPPNRARAIEDIDPWDFNFAKLDKESLYELILAANYLDIKPLIQVCCKMIANMIRGKNIQQIREEFNIINDFTEEEEAEIRKENAWIENR
ncbi:S-phase kinase-associated protein 1A-like protein [Neoconidiobolus thromboides FSU 785]|nr:S-phase kinase-associated protein 1A-like protein [Neoconidiobolus thromboides FSU 785]